MKRQLTILALLGLIIAALAWQLRFESRLSVFFLGEVGPGMKMVEKLQHQVFARRYLLAVAPKEKNAAEAAGLVNLGQTFLQQLIRQPGVAKAWPAFEPPVSINQVIRRYASHAWQIYSLNPEQEARRLLSIDALPQRAALLKQSLLSPFGDLIQQIAPQDPLLLTLEAFADWRDKLQDNSRTLEDFYPIVLESQAAAFDFTAQRELQKAIRQLFDQLVQTTGAELELTMTGVPVFAVAAQSRIQADVNQVTLISSLGVMVVFILLFRNLKSLLATFLVLAFAFATGALAVQVSFGYVHGLTLALGATLIGVCVDYPIHVMAHWRGGQTDGELIAKRLWPALIMGGGTTVVGYLALAATGYPGFRQIAVFASVGIVTALLMTRYGLPAFLGKNRSATPLKVPGLTAWLALCRRYPLWLKGAVVVLLAGALLVIPKLQWLDDLERLAAIDPKLRQQDRAIRTRLGGIEPGRAVLIEGRDLETALIRAEAATRVLRRLKHQKSLHDFHGIYPLLVSRKLQEKNALVYTSQLTPALAEYWRWVLSEQGLAADVLGNLTPNNKSWLDNEAALRSEVAEFLVGQWEETEEGVQLAFWLGPHQPQAVREALAGLAGVSYFSQRAQINALAERYRQRAIVALSMGLGVIFAGLWWRYRTPVTALRVLLPALTGMVFILAAFALLKLPVSFFHLIAALLAIAICVDYGIFYSEHRGGDPDATFQAMGASMLTTLTAFAALGAAQLPVLKMLSLAVTCGVVAGFLLCPVMIPTKSD